MSKIYKYPRTHHLEGSRLQPGDEDLSQTPLAALAGKRLVVEEKVDGGNCGVSFDAAGRLLLQSRGHFLDGGPRERHFALLKTWANRWRAELHTVLETRYVLYGEWLYAKHTAFYDALPHYFLEFDVLDTETGEFLSTPARRRLLAALPVVSVPVVWEGAGETFADPSALVRRSLYKTDDWRESLVRAARELGLREDRVVAETDGSDLAEGLYVKVEDDDRVLERYKFVRASFLQSIADSGSHWLDRPIVPNGLADGVDLFAEA